MNKKTSFSEDKSVNVTGGGGGDAAVAVEKLCELIESVELLCEKLIAIGDFGPVVASLEAICEKLLTAIENLDQLVVCIKELKEFISELNDCLTELKDSLNSVICPKPICASSTVEPVTYTNTDENTELTVSVGSEGDIKISSGNGDDSDAEITAYIESCLAAGNDVEITSTGVGGETASATLLSEAETNPFPDFYNDSINAVFTGNAVFKVQTMTATCLETVEEAGVTLKTYDQCTVEAIKKLCEKLDMPTADITTCCTGGATETTAKCANIPKSWTTLSLGDYDTCTASFGGISLPDDNYVYADFEALILSVGGTIEPNPNNPDQYTICVPDDFSTCYSRACFKDRVGQLVRACVVPLPNTTEPECIDFQRTWGKYEEPIANILQTSLDTQQQMLDKLCEDAGACVREPLAGNWCDITFGNEPDDEDIINAENILILVETCGSQQSLLYFTADAAGELIPYDVLGSIVDCDTYQEPLPEPPSCPAGAVFEQVCIPPNTYGILDNSRWEGAPLNHLQNSQNMVIDLIAEDGTRTSIGPLSNPYYVDFRTQVEAALPDCKVVFVCANHTSPRGCNAGQVANLANYPVYDSPTYPADIQNNLTNPDQDELWASGWLLDCGGCQSPIVSAEITSATDPAWIGTTKQIKTYEGEEQILFRAVTCDGVFWKDCYGNDVLSPVGGCCAMPCKSSDKDAELTAAKLCLIEEHLNPAGPCPVDVVELDKELQTLTLIGDVTANYSAGQDVNLQNTNGESCGTATVADGESVNLVDGNTVITLVECELEEGKTAVQITKATPISVPVKTAIATVKTLTAVKTISKTVIKEPVKEVVRG